MCVVYTILTGVWSADYNTTDISFNSPRFLPDGLLLTGGGDTRTQIATWTVLITIARPYEIAGLHTKLDFFKTTIEKLRGVHEMANDTIVDWKIRIAEIEETMTRPTPRVHRDRRGLLNVFGDLSKTLFGTATDEDVQAVKRQLRIFGKINHQVVHTVSELLTIVNHTHDQLISNRKHIISLQKYSEQMANVIRIADAFMNQTENRFEFLLAKVRLEQTMRALESTHEHWLRQVLRFERQQASLELGFLTEELIDRKELMQIIKSGRRAGFYAPNINWFYSNIRIAPIQWTGRQLIFRVKLPLTDKVLYKRYHLWSWPIPGNTSSYNVKVQSTADFAIHTITGGIFQPTFCKGEHPSICRAGAIYDRTRFQCPRGILTGEQSLRKQCKVTVTKALTEETTVMEFLPGTFVILTHGETISLLCSGDPEVRLSLLQGAYALRLREGCHVTAKGWYISGIARLSSAVMVGFSVIAVPPLPIMEMIHPATLNRHLNTPTWEAFGEIKNIELNNLPTVIGDTDVWENYVGHVSLSGAIILGLVILVVIYILYELCRRKVIWTPTVGRPATARRHTGEADLHVPLDVQVSDADAMVPLTRSQHDVMQNMPSAWQNVQADTIVV